MPKLDGEIQYRKVDNTWVHSDFDSGQDREYLHKLLDEYLDNIAYHYRGFFYIGNREDLSEEFTDV
jgi:hypothetical protein